jgi:GlpG protein
MRLIGRVADKAQAERFAAFLLTREIESMTEEAAGQWEIWIRDEDAVDSAKAELERFRSQPGDQQYLDAVHAAQLIHRNKSRQEVEQRKRQVTISQDRWSAPIHKVAPLTVVLIAMSLVVSLFTNFGQDVNGFAMRALALGTATPQEVLDLMVSEKLPEDAEFWNRLRLNSLLKLEFWRAITPIFIHFGGWHFLFNMIWLATLGRPIETRYGSWWLLLLVILIAVPSNVIGIMVPERMDGVPIVNLGSSWLIMMGGMSGVVYGLFGYVLMKMLFDPKSGFYISFSTTAFMLVWLLLCMSPVFQDWLGMRVANWAHGIGLLVGAAIGYFPKLLSDIGIRTAK